MKKYFNNIGIVGIPRFKSSFVTHELLYFWLHKKGYNVFIENNLVKKLFLINPMVLSLSDIGKYCDLAIVIGGDGNILRAGRVLSSYKTFIIGINRGNFGFLTDLNYNNIFKTILKILSGKFKIEKRFLLEVKVYRKNIILNKDIAINEIVIHPEKVTNMFEFDIFINGKFAFSQRSDGLIISTPTGSTGYALSAGGPIVETSLDVIILLPMFAHTLSVRPLVINNNNIIYIKFKDVKGKLKISLDGNVVIPIKKNDIIFISKSKLKLSLVHPLCYNYYDVLNVKLNWSKKFF
ncbi:NAD(+) kinase [Buchnera aphidicola]|uniref:NAD(+) kinase n=1 Tax=Buchnera aphidicola TaxID=9 RepID=UPI0031B82643